MHTTASLLQPPPHLSSCVFAGIARDTRGVTLTDAERFNHFPASPLVSVTYVIQGALHLVPTGATLADAKAAPPVPVLSVVPPMDHPVSSWSAGPVAVVTLGIYPEAWQKLTDAGAKDRFTRCLKDAFDTVRDGQGFDSCWSGFNAQVAPIWQGARATGGIADWSGSTRLADWSRSILGRAALAGPGRSMRAFERRLRRWTRQSRQSLKFYADFENLHQLQTQKANTSLADLAVDAGYSDQSHMGRAVRRATGFSPAQLNRMVESEEPFWCYRLLGERF